MAILKFRVYFAEDETIYRDIVIKHDQTFFDLHQIILTAYNFDNKHQATFFRSNSDWEEGREISLDVYEKNYVVAPLLMKETPLNKEIKVTDQRFVYEYDFVKKWRFHILLISLAKESNPKTIYPSISRKEGLGPPQYGIKSLLGEKFPDIESKLKLADLRREIEESSTSVHSEEE